MNKVTIIVNKSWEADPVIHAITSMKIKPAGFPFPVELNIPRPSPLSSMSAPKQIGYRALFEIRDPKTSDVLLSATIWCIEDLMHADKHGSSSEEKALCLAELYEKEKGSDLVIAVGTAGFNDRYTSMNGSVVIGAEFVTFDAIPDNRESEFKHELLGRYLPSNLPEVLQKNLFAIFKDSFKDIVSSKLLPVPNQPAERCKVMAASNYVALSNVNITNYNDYAWADEAGLKHYEQLEVRSPVGSIETTHGVIRICSTIPTIFVSAISDRLGYFASEITPGQNYVSSFNAGILLSYLIPELVNV